MISAILAIVVTHTFHMEGVAHRVVSVRAGWKWFLCPLDGLSNSIVVGGILLEVLCLVRGVLYVGESVFRSTFFDSPLWLVHTGVLGVTRAYVNLIG